MMRFCCYQAYRIHYLLSLIFQIQKQLTYL
nr:MAG TPA: hypothetical protein [Caudoviricetes sp.]DAT39815.1 MAG TPA: hypothetical protein [Caudoviricetes sp.]